MARVVSEKGQRCKAFSFDKVFTQSATQSQVYEEAQISHLVRQTVQV